MLGEWIDAWVVTEEYARLVVGLIISTVVFGFSAAVTEEEMSYNALTPVFLTIFAGVSLVGFALSTLGILILRVLTWVVTGE